MAIWLDLTEKLIGAGPVLREIRNVQIAAERACATPRPENWEKCRNACTAAVLMTQGACNVALKDAHEDNPEEAAAAAEWRGLYERAIICMHNLDKLPEEMRRWRGEGSE